MPTATQYARVRSDLKWSALTDAQIDDWYARAEARYDTLTDAVEAQVRIYGVRELIMEAAKNVDYKQGQSSESLSQQVVNLSKYALPIFKNDLLEALEAGYPNAMWGALRRPRSTIVEYPEDMFDYLTDPVLLTSVS